MKLVLFVVLLLSILQFTNAVRFGNSQETQPAEASSANELFQTLLQGAMKDPKGALSLVNQILPIIKAFTNKVDPSSAKSVTSYTYQWCMQSTQGANIFCIDTTWNFVVGWRAFQFHDDNRFYNLTVTPFAYMQAIVNVTTEGDPVKFSIGPNFQLVNFQAPLSFEMVDKDTLCYSGTLAVNPVTIDAGLGARFLECQTIIPESQTSCSWTERLAARFFYSELNVGYYSSLLDRTCVHSG